MGKLFATVFLLISNLCFCQLKSVIIDGETKEKIPYVNIWIENENVGTTSNENGKFELTVGASKIIIFSAIGFETKRIISDSVQSIVKLNPVITQLNEVVIKSNKPNQILTIGGFKKSKINHYFACGTTLWISARYFEFKENYKETSFLETIKILTKSKTKDSKFNIRLYGANENGEPENYIYDKNIIVIAKKGKNLTEINISELNIEFPKNGFFIAFEWLLVENNKYEFNYTVKGSKKKHIGIQYAPKIGLVSSKTNKNSWIFSQGKWMKTWKNNNDNSKKYRNKYNLIAMELTLTN
ncbi:MAG: carboxypeptidase-like regulatory domain-containing protein [Flavobacteriaceae bacterium]|nr:MAG: carboxypeptidase-like regulatory domain-containing protein [Flavobacteriaceae bacterium]